MLGTSYSCSSDGDGILPETVEILKDSIDYEENDGISLDQSISLRIIVKCLGKNRKYIFFYQIKPG